MEKIDIKNVWKVLTRVLYCMIVMAIARVVTQKTKVEKDTEEIYTFQPEQTRATIFLLKKMSRVLILSWRHISITRP